MARPSSLSGFPEWLPAGRLLEQQILDTLRRTFELHGFAPIETRAVEPLAQLERKGEIDKEIYVLERLQAARHATEDSERGTERQLGLHFDLTVPFARYVVENAGRLVFPFKRYQIQKVWRGERPQEGRFREFLQADIDVVGAGELPAHYEIELPLVMLEALRSLPIPAVHMRVNNRKVVEGFYRGIGLEDIDGALRVVDKLDKIGSAAVSDVLISQELATAQQAEKVLALAAITAADLSFVDAVQDLGVRSDLLDTGLAELAELVEQAGEAAPGAVVADLRIARGLDYYTGSVYETTLLGHENLGSICSGGRYDSLAAVGSNTRYPGVGLSIGVSRLVSRIIGDSLATMSRPVPTAVLVAVVDADRRTESARIAAALRARGIPADVSPTAAKFGKQIRAADRLAIPFVWFPGEPGASDQVKDVRSGEQTDADMTSWTPPAEDLWPRMVRG